MCARAGKLRQRWQYSSIMTAGQFYSQILTLRLRFSCFRETSKGVRGANHVERGGTLGGGGRDFVMDIKFF